MMRRAFLRTAWAPPVLWGATLVYLRPYDGWGAWAAAPLLLPSFLLSALWAGFGLVLLGRAAARDRRLDLPVLAGTLLGGAAALYYIVSYLIRSTH